MMVGSTQAPGMLRIYRLENSTWSLIQQLDESASSSYFTTHVDISDNGDVIVVGAHGEAALGRAFAYRYNGMQWLLEQTLFGSDAENGDRFGYAVSLSADGSRVALSAPFDDGEANASDRSGASYIFEFSNNSWQEVALIRASSPMTEGFGLDTRLSPLGDKLASVGWDSQGVYVYDLSDSDASNWQASEYYLASPSATNDLFGTRNNLSFNGFDVLVGARNDDRAFQGVVINSDDDADFDTQDNTSTGTSFDNTSTAASNSGAAYMVAYEPYALDSTAALQTRIDAVNIVLAWAAGGAIAPSEQDYIDAEITDVTVSNLADVNMQLQLFAHTDMFAVQPMVNSINVIQVYASDNTQTEPNLTDYATAGITGVSGANLSDVNGQVDSQSLTTVASIQTVVDSLTSIQSYAADNTQTAPTVTNYADIGVTGVDANNLSEINGQVDSQSLTSTTAIQLMVDGINVVLAYSADASSTAPTVSDYTASGISGVDIDDLALLNSYVGGQNVTMAELPTLVIKADNLNVLLGYSADSTNTEPIDTNYSDAGLTDPRSINTSDYNQVLADSNFTTEAQIQALVDAINALDDYATDQTNPAPTFDTYMTAGFDTAKQTQIDSLNQALAANTLLTLAEIELVVDGLLTLTDYALDDTNTPPTVQDYLDAGLTDVSVSLLGHLNQTLGRDGEPGFTEYFKSSTPHGSDYYGFKTALSEDGNILAVLARRAPGVENNASEDTGAVYVYRRSGTSWAEVAILRSNQTTYHANDMTMSADGTRIIMLAPTYAYVFDVPVVGSEPDWDGAWLKTTYPHGSSENLNTLAISADGNTIVVGERVYNSTGRIRIHQLVNGNWTFQQQFSGDLAGSDFGAVMDISENGNVIAVGAYDRDNSRGHAYIYRHNGTSWVNEQAFRNANSDTSDNYGYSISLSDNGNRLAVGAFGEDGPTNNVSAQGAVFIHEYDGSNWTETQVLRASNATSSRYYGRHVALSPTGNRVAVTTSNSEAVYYYDLTSPDSTQWNDTEVFFASPATDEDEFGVFGLAFNGNAIAVGAYYDDNAFAGIVSNTEFDSDFNELDSASVGTFDKTDNSATNSGAAYLIRLNADVLTSLTPLQARIDASNVILAWAAGGSTAPTVTDYLNASIDDVTVDNLSDLNIQLQSLAHTEMVNVQPMVDGINTIIAYTTDVTNPVPTNTDYTLAGIDGVNLDNADTLNGYVGGQNVAVADIPALVTQVEHLLVLRAYSADATNTEPILTNFTGAGFSTSRAVNLTDYNSELVNQTLTTEAEFQALVDAINALDDYVDGTIITAPSLATYQTAGFDEVKDVNLAVINTALINNTLTSLSDVQTAVSALDTLVNYAIDNTSTTPTVADYTNAGVTSVSTSILDYLNNHMDKEKREGLTHYLKASNVDSGDYYGFETAISDDGLTMALLGQNAPTTSSATDDGGAIYIYRRAGASWQEVKILRTEQTTYHASDMVMSADGKRVVMIGPTMAYVFDVDFVDDQPDWDGSWTMTSVNHGITDTSNYGAISADGNVLVIGDDSYSSNAGRVRIYQFTNGSWSYQNQFTGGSGSFFGFSSAVSSNGDVIAVGAFDQGNTGYVYVYRHNGSNWAFEQSFRNANYATDDYFGSGVSINAAGDRIAVGARQEDGPTNSMTSQGAVFVFDHNGSSWSETQVLRASDAATSDGFGYQTQLSADGLKLVVSTLNGEAVYSYDLANTDTSQWQTSEKIFSSPSSSTVEFGTYAIAFNGTDIVVGAPYDDHSYNGILTNSDNNTVFDGNDTSSTGTAFDNTDTSLLNSGGVYVIANEPYALSSLDSLQTRVDGSNAILAWAAGGSTAPTVQQYKDTGIENVTASNLADMNTQLQSLAHTEMANVQPMVDAINTIIAYTTDATNTEPTLTEYQFAGITNVTADNLALLNVDVGDEDLTLSEIQLTAVQLSHLVLIRNYSQDSSNTAPTLENYTGANIGVPRAVNVLDYNTVIADALFTTRSAFENVVDSINALDDYADGTTTTAPTVTTYHTAGFTDLRALHVELINNVVQTDGLNTLSSIASVIASLDAIQAYAIDSNTTPPTLEQYTDLKLTGISADILAYLNNHLIKEKSEGLTHYLKASDAQAGDQFGYATAMSRDGLTLAVLAWKAPSDNTTTDDAGAVYLYRRQGSSWQEVAILRTNQTINHLSEVAMSADGRRVIASALNQAFVFDVPIVNDVPQWGDTWSMTVVNHGISNAVAPSLAINGQGNIMMVGSTQAPGMLRIYRLENSTWSLIQQLDEPASSSYFTTHVDISDNGDVIVVGAHGEAGLGRAFAYRYNGMQWLLEQTLFGSDAENGDRFGYAVSLSADGSRVALSAPRDGGEANASYRSGATYIFDFSNNSWQEVALIRALSPMNGGKGVDGQLSPLGDKLATVGYGSQGVYVYDLSDSDASNWQASEYYLASPSASNDLFGNRNNLSFNGVDVLVGAMNDDRAFQGIVSNSDDDADFDAQDNTSTGTSFDNTSTAASNSGAAYVVAYEPYALDSTAALQTRIDAVNIVLAWAAGGATAPSEQDYIDAEITDVTASNLADVNMQLQLFAHTDMFAVQPMVNSINVIQTYAMDNTQTAPSVTDYVTAGISGVSATNLSDVNGQVDSQSLTPMASVQTMVDSFNIIQAYAADNTQPAPSEMDFTNIGVTGITALNLADVNAQVNAQTLTSTASIQTVVSSFTVIENYAADNTQTAPTETDFSNIGVTGVSATNLSDINEQVDSQSLTSTANIQTLVDSHNRIATYAADNTQTPPELSDYTNIGVSGVDTVNLADVNEQVDGQSLSTLSNVQTMVTSLNVIENYAADNTQTAPSVTDYANLGVTGVSASNLLDVNAEVNSQSLSTFSALQTLVSSLNVIEVYAQDNTQPAPQESDYLTVGITGVDALNLADINQQVDEQSLLAVDDIRALAASLTTIRAYAADNTQPAPVLNDYLTVGVAAVDTNN
ncbi:MAG: hypothetical protein GY881_12980, partial [Gammaproteobacteria bacterium]|nr:hypothetical protein [Gammaproteobacteria bacterium]